MSMEIPHNLRAYAKPVEKAPLRKVEPVTPSNPTKNQEEPEEEKERRRKELERRLEEARKKGGIDVVV